MYALRFWLSFHLLNLGVRACPDESSRHWLRYGLHIAGKGIEDGLTNEGTE